MTFENSLEGSTEKGLPTIGKWWVIGVGYGILIANWIASTIKLASASTRLVTARMSDHLSECLFGLDTLTSTPIRENDTPLAPSRCSFLDYLQRSPKTFVLLYYGARELSTKMERYRYFRFI